MTQNSLVEYESKNAPLLGKLCTIHDRERNRTKFSKMEELKLSRPMLTSTLFVMQNLLAE